MRGSQTSERAIPGLRNARKVGAARLSSLVLTMPSLCRDRAGALRLLTRRCLRGDALIGLDAARPGSIGAAEGTSAITAVPRDRANERNVGGRTCFWSGRHESRMPHSWRRAKKFSTWRAGRECWRAKLLSVFSRAARSALSFLKVEVVLVGGREIGDEVCGPLVVSPGLEVSATNGPIVYGIINWIFGERS
jgi:hypothetical protein